MNKMLEVPNPADATHPGAVVDRMLRLIECDLAFARLLSIAPESSVGQPITQLRPDLEAPLRTVLTHEQVLSRVAVRSGQLDMCWLRFEPLRTSRGTLAGVEIAVEPGIPAPSVDGNGTGPTLPLPPAHTILDSLFAFVGVLLPDGTLIEANRAALDAARLSPEQVLQRPFVDTFWWAYDPGIQADLRAAIARAAQGEIVRYDVMVRLAVDYFITIDFMLAPIRDAQGRIQYLIPSAIDISDRIRAEAVMRDHQRHLNLALQTAQMGTWEIDLRTLAVQRSASTDQLFGLTPDDRVRRIDEYLDCIHPADRERIRRAMQRSMQDGTEYQAEYRVIWPDGSEHWHSSRGERVGYVADRSQRLIGALVDITDRKTTEAALDVSEARFRATFDYAPVGIAHVGLDGRWLRVNEQLCAIVGYSHDELLAHTFQDITHPDDLGADLELMNQLLAGEIAMYDLEKRYVRKDGRLIWAHLTVSLLRNSAGEPVHCISVVEDINQRKLIEAELRFQAQLLDAVGQGVIATRLDGTIQFWNRFAEQLYGWPREEALGRNILDLVATDMSRAQGEEIMARLQAGVSWEGRYQVRRRNGEMFPAFVTDTPLHDADGRLTGFVGVSTDISRQLQLEDERAELFQRELAARAEADEARALLETLFTSAPVGLCFLTTDYRYVRINNALATLNDQPAADHLGRSVRDIVPDLALVVEPIFAQVLDTGTPLIDQEIVEERSARNGGRRIWRASYYPVRVPDGAIIGLGIIASDITTYHTAVDALRVSEERFRVALQNSPIFVYTTDRDLRYTWVYNLPALFEATEVIGRRDEELLPPTEAARLTRLKQRVLDQARGEREEIRLVIANRPLIYDLTVEPLRDSEGGIIGLTVAAIDITAHRMAEAALSESEARYSTLAEAVPAILFTNRPDGFSDYISQNFYDFTGAPRGSGEGYGWADLVHPDDQERTVQAWQESVRTGTPFLIEYRFRRYDGVYRWFRVHSRPIFDAAGTISKWFGVCLDIDDARQAAIEREQLLVREQAARATAERVVARLAQLQALTAALSEALTPGQVAEVIVNRSLAALGANGGALRLISTDRQSLITLYGAGVPGKVASQWEQVPLDAALPICDVARSGRPRYFTTRESLIIAYPQLEDVLVSLDYEASAIIPLHSEGHCIGSLALVFADMRHFSDDDDDVLQAMASLAVQAIERARLYEQVRTAVEIRDNFIAIASHDLRSPLTVLIGQAQLLERRAYSSTPEQTVQRARLIIDQARRLNRLVGALLDLSRIQSQDMSIDVAQLDLAAFAVAIVADMQPAVDSHTLQCTGSTAGIWVMGDAVRLEQVLYNLIGNAVKYSPAGTRVMIAVECQDMQARITVTDEGIGIPGEALPHVFGRYYRASNVRAQGMGIGLYAVHEIVRLHGGTVSVTSQEGLGSSFTVALPCIVPPPA